MSESVSRWVSECLKRVSERVSEQSEKSERTEGGKREVSGQGIREALQLAPMMCLPVLRTGRMSSNECDPVMEEKLVVGAPVRTVGPDASSEEIAAVMKDTVVGLEMFLRGMRLRHAKAFADSANRIAIRLATSDMNDACSASFERYLCEAEASPRRLLQIAVEAEKIPLENVVYGDCAAMNKRLKELVQEEQDMHEKDVAAKESMYEAYEASLVVDRQGCAQWR